MSALVFRPGSAVAAEPADAPATAPTVPPATVRRSPSALARFVHLRLHSEYSIVDGTVRIDDAVAAAVADKMPALNVSIVGLPGWDARVLAFAHAYQAQSHRT